METMAPVDLDTADIHRVAVNVGDGEQPIGRGHWPNDVLAVLQGSKEAPQDLRARALALAGT